MPPLQKALCVQGCPVNVHIPDFIQKVAEGDYIGAFDVITSTNTLPAICAASARRRPSARQNVSAA